MPSIDLGPLDQFPEGQARRVTADGRSLAIVRKGESIYALRDICPHQGAALSAGHLSGHVPPCRPGQDIKLECEGEILICPWHGWEFDIKTGCSLIDPDRVRVRSYNTRVENGRVLVTIS